MQAMTQLLIMHVKMHMRRCEISLKIKIRLFNNCDPITKPKSSGTKCDRRAVCIPSNQQALSCWNYKKRRSWLVARRDVHLGTNSSIYSNFPLSHSVTGKKKEKKRRVIGVVTESSALSKRRLELRQGFLYLLPTAELRVIWWSEYLCYLDGFLGTVRVLLMVTALPSAKFRGTENCNLTKQKKKTFHDTTVPDRVSFVSSNQV